MGRNVRTCTKNSRKKIMREDREESRRKIKKGNKERRMKVRKEDYFGYTNLQAACT